MFIIKTANTMAFSVGKKRTENDPSNILRDEYVFRNVDTGEKFLFIDNQVDFIPSHYNNFLTFKELVDGKSLLTKHYEDRVLGLIVKNDFTISIAEIKEGKLNITPIKMGIFDVYCNNDIVNDMMYSCLRYKLTQLSDKDDINIFAQLEKGEGPEYDDIINTVVSIHNEHDIYQANYISINETEFDKLLDDVNLPFLSLTASDRVVEVNDKTTVLKPYQEIRNAFLLTKTVEENKEASPQITLEPNVNEINTCNEDDIFFKYNGQEIPLGIRKDTLYAKKLCLIAKFFTRYAEAIDGCTASINVSGDRVNIDIDFNDDTMLHNHNQLYELIKQFQKQYGTEIEFASVSLS